MECEGDAEGALDFKPFEVLEDGGVTYAACKPADAAGNCDEVWIAGGKHFGAVPR